jgi:hypothetical protein
MRNRYLRVGLLMLSVVLAIRVLFFLRTQMFNPYSEPVRDVIYDGRVFMYPQLPAWRPALWMEVSAIVATLVATMLSDLACLGVIRWLLRRAEGLETLGKAAMTLGSTCVVGGVLFLGPALWYTRVPVAHRQLLPRLIAESNALDAAICAMCVGSALTMLLHRAVWPIVGRPLLALANDRVVLDHRGKVFGAGLVLVGIAVPGVVPWIKNHMP